MKNCERYSRTLDALDAWAKSGSCETVKFNVWAGMECEDSDAGDENDLLSAATRAGHYLDSLKLDETGIKIYNGLVSAVQRESSREKTNYERFNGPKEAYEEFNRLCNSTRCTECRIADRATEADTTNFSHSCVTEWLYSTEPELRG